MSDRFGRHRVLSPRGSLPQQAEALDPSLPIRDDELLISVDSINVDSASFHQIKTSCGSEPAIIEHIRALVSERGKLHNRVTGSGGMLIGRVAEIGPRFLERNPCAKGLVPGDPVATLVSLTLTPLSLRSVTALHPARDRIDVEGHAILFESGIFAKLPADLPRSLSLAVLDVCGAPAQTAAICGRGQTVAILGGGGKSGLLCAHEARKAIGPEGKLIILDYGSASLERARATRLADHVEACDARDAVAAHDIVRELTAGAMADLVINVTNVPDTEMATVLSARHGGSAYFFNMATSFTKATLGAEGSGSHVRLLMGNGYVPGHADLALDILRQNGILRSMFEGMYAED